MIARPRDEHVDEGISLCDTQPTKSHVDGIKIEGILATAAAACPRKFPARRSCRKKHM